MSNKCTRAIRGLSSAAGADFVLWTTPHRDPVTASILLAVQLATPRRMLTPEGRFRALTCRGEGIGGRAGWRATFVPAENMRTKESRPVIGPRGGCPAHRTTGAAPIIHPNRRPDRHHGRVAAECGRRVWQLPWGWRRTCLGACISRMRSTILLSLEWRLADASRICQIWPKGMCFGGAVGSEEFTSFGNHN